MDLMGRYCISIRNLNECLCRMSQIFKAKYCTVFLKGQWRKIFDPFYVGQKTSPGPHIDRLMRFRVFFRFRTKCSVCLPRSWLYSPVYGQRACAVKYLHVYWVAASFFAFGMWQCHKIFTPQHFVSYFLLKWAELQWKKIISA